MERALHPGPVATPPAPELHQDERPRYYEFGVYKVDVLLRTLFRNGVPVPLVPKAFDTLTVLIERRDHVVSRDELIAAVWPSVNVEAANLTQNIFVIRKAIEADGERYIVTFPGRGYRFVGETVEIRDGPPQQDPEVTPPNPVPSASTVSRFGPKYWATLLATLTVAAAIGAVVILFVGERNATPPKSRFLTSLPGMEIEPVFSPDGKRVVFGWNGKDENNFDLYVKGIDDEKYVRLTSDPAVDASPAWSPDGRYIAFLRLSPDRGGIYTVPSAGGPERKVADVNTDRHGIKARHLDWSPDGKELIFDDRLHPQETLSLYSLSLQTGLRRRLTWLPGLAWSDLAPRFSPDGTQIAFIRSTAATVRDIYLMPASGGQPVQITTDHRWIGDVDWTPDGRHLLFSSDRAGVPALWEADAKPHSRIRPVNPDGENAHYLSVSRQGQQLIYSHSVTDVNVWQLRLSSDGHEAGWSKLIASTRDDSAPDYSLDGKQIVFRSDRSGSREIWICERDGSNARLVRTSGSPSSASLSPDGKNIAFDAYDGTEYHVYVVPVAGGQSIAVAPSHAEDVLPKWSPDGRHIYFASNRTGVWQVWKATPSTNQLAQITRQGGYAPRVSADGKTLYYSKHPTLPGIWKVPIDGGDESVVFTRMDPERWGLWTAAREGIYFIDCPVSGLAPPPALKLFRFADRKITTVALLPGPAVITGALSLAASPDSRALLVPALDQDSSDIVDVLSYRAIN